MDDGISFPVKGCLNGALSLDVMRENPVPDTFQVIRICN